MDRFKLMETYEAVVRLGGYTPASKELGVTRAMVSKRIFELEHILNVRLLNRTTQRIGTTAAGIEYYQSCLSVLADVRRIEERLIARRKDAKGELRILSSKTLGEIVVAPILAQFCAKYPGIRPHLVLRDLGTDEHDLVSRGFDLSIRPQDMKVASLVAKPIIPLPRVLVAAPAYLERNELPRNPTDLRSHNCLSSNGEDHSEWDFDGKKGRITVNVAGTFKANSNTVIRHAVLRGIGIGLLGEHVVKSDIAAGRLVRILDAYTVPPRMLHVLYLKDRYQPLRTRLFIDFLTERVNEPQLRAIA